MGFSYVELPVDYPAIIARTATWPTSESGEILAVFAFMKYFMSVELRACFFDN